MKCSCKSLEDRVSWIVVGVAESEGVVCLQWLSVDYENDLVTLEIKSYLCIG